MTNRLKELQAEAREKFPESFDERGANLLFGEHTELDELVAHVYTEAIRECIGKVPPEAKVSDKEELSPYYEGLVDGSNEFRSETIKAISSLISTKD